MKETKIVAVIVGFLAAIVFAASAHAQDRVVIGDKEIPSLQFLADEALKLGSPAKPAAPRVTIDMGIAGGQLKNTISWPWDQSFKRSDNSDTRGVDLDATVRLTDSLNVGFHFKRDGLHNSTIRERHEYHHSDGKTVREQEWVNPGENMGTRQYKEVYATIAIPHSFGHSIIGGFAWDSINENQRYEDVYGGITESGHQNAYRGVLVGGKGVQNFRALTADYAVRLDFTPLGLNSINGNLRSHMVEVSETAIWNFSPHVGIGGGHEFVTHWTRSTSFHQDQGGHRFLLKTRLAF